MTAALELIEQPAPTAAEPPAMSQRPLTVIEYAVQRGATVAEVRAMMELQVQADNHQLALMKERRIMEKEDREAAAVLAFRRDFAAFRGANIIVPKSKHVDRGKAGSFMQAEFHIAASKLSPALSTNHFSFRHDQKFGTKDWPADGSNEGIPAGTMLQVPWVYVTCFLEHRDGHAERLDLDGPPGDGTANSAIQNMQVSASMLKRLSLLAITGTATGGEDDEGRLRRGMEGEEAQQHDAADAPLLQAGRDASMSGMKPLADWWGKLTDPQRARLTSEFGEMKKAARKADDAGKARTAP